MLEVFHDFAVVRCTAAQRRRVERALEGVPGEHARHVAESAVRRRSGESSTPRTATRRAAAASILRVYLLLISALALRHLSPHVRRENLGAVEREAAPTSRGNARKERSRTHVVCV